MGGFSLLVEFLCRGSVCSLQSILVSYDVLFIPRAQKCANLWIYITDIAKSLIVMVVVMSQTPRTEG